MTVSFMNLEKTALKKQNKTKKSPPQKKQLPKLPFSDETVSSFIFHTKIVFFPHVHEIIIIRIMCEGEKTIYIYIYTYYGRTH